MSEIEKALAELKALMKYRSEQLGYVEDFRGLGLTSRKNLCLHPSVRREKSGSVVDARCRSLTAGFVKEKKERGEDVDLCVYHEVCLRIPALQSRMAEIRRIWISWSHIASCPPGFSRLTASSNTAKRTSNARTSQLGEWYCNIFRTFNSY